MRWFCYYYFNMKTVFLRKNILKDMLLKKVNLVFVFLFFYLSIFLLLRAIRTFTFYIVNLKRCLNSLFLNNFILTYISITTVQRMYRLILNKTTFL